MNNLISIVLPVYNGEKYLRKSIESVRQQTYSNWELIIIDDCSTDSSPEIAEEYVVHDNRIHYYRNAKNLKLPRSLNRGFELSNGDYLTWTSDDNIYMPTAFEKMAEVLDHQSSIGFVFTDYYSIDGNDTIICEYIVPANYSDQIIGKNIVGACFLYRREVYENVGDYQHGLLYVEDYDYWQRVFACYKVKCIHEFLYKYRVHEQSLSGKTRTELINKSLERAIRANASLRPRMNVAQKYYYYYGIYRCSLSRNDSRIVFGYWFYRWVYYNPTRLLGKIKKVLNIG